MPQNYSDTLDFIYNTLPAFSRIGSTAYKQGLSNIVALCNALGNPQNKFPSVHIAGTNGKGSVSHLLAAAFQHAGYKTGLYTSPHLVDFRERFRINGKMIDQQFVVDFVNKHESLIYEIKPSYYEITVAIAFSVFAAQKVDIAIVETGLGGRLDSTNIIFPELSVITQINYDHMAILGDTLPKIAAEKAGIIKRKIPVVIGETQAETKPVFDKTAQQKNAPISYADKKWEVLPTKLDDRYQYFQAGSLVNEKEHYAFKCDLRGTYQRANLTTALASLEILNQKGWQLGIKPSLESFSSVKRLTGLHGRWETISEHPKIILEVAHNIGGMTYLKSNLATEKIPKNACLRIILGFVKDKDIAGILKILPHQAVYYFTQAAIPRALDAAQLSIQANAADLSGNSYETIEKAITTVFSEMSEHDMLLITGSIFVVGEALSVLGKMSSFAHLSL